MSVNSEALGKIFEDFIKSSTNNILERVQSEEIKTWIKHLTAIPTLLRERKIQDVARAKRMIKVSLKAALIRQELELVREEMSVITATVFNFIRLLCLTLI